MNQDASDKPPREDDSPASAKPEGATPASAEPDGAAPASENSSADQTAASDNPAPIVATLADSEEVIRVGSPFAVDPTTPEATRPIEALYDVGPLRYTAMGAVAASVMVLGFAAAAAWWFPAGGALIAALGCVLSIFGLYSVFRFTSAGLLVLHLGLFVVSYGRSLG